MTKLTLVTRITNVKTPDRYESYETPFRVNMPKLFHSFRVGLERAFFCEALLIIVQVNRSMRNIMQQHLFDI